MQHTQRPPGARTPPFGRAQNWQSDAGGSSVARACVIAARSVCSFRISSLRLVLTLARGATATNGAASVSPVAGVSGEIVAASTEDAESGAPEIVASSSPVDPDRPDGSDVVSSPTAASGARNSVPPSETAFGDELAAAPDATHGFGGGGGGAADRGGSYESR